MLVVDASCLAEVVIGGAGAPAIGEWLVADADHATPHVIDVEVFGSFGASAYRVSLRKACQRRCASSNSSARSAEGASTLIAACPPGGGPPG